MGRSSGKEKKKGKNGKNAKEPALKVKPAKRSKFSAKNNDLVHVPKNQLLGNPTSYLYGKQAISAKELQKRIKSVISSRNGRHHRISSVNNTDSQLQLYISSSEKLFHIF